MVSQSHVSNVPKQACAIHEVNLNRPWLRTRWCRSDTWQRVLPSSKLLDSHGVLAILLLLATSAFRQLAVNRSPFESCFGTCRVLSSQRKRVSVYFVDSVPVASVHAVALLAQALCKPCRSTTNTNLAPGEPDRSVAVRRSVSRLFRLCYVFAAVNCTTNECRVGVAL